MNNFLKDKREIIALLTYILIIAALVYLVVLPIQKKIEAVRNEIQEDILKQEATKQRIAELPKMEQQYNFLTNSNAFERALLNNDEAVLLIERLEQMAVDTSNKITIAATENAKVNNANKKQSDGNIIDSLPSNQFLQLKITLNGSYNSIVKFIAAIENFSYHADIVGIDISDRKNENVAELDAINNPFGGTNKKIVNVSTDGPLEGKLDIVFYTK